MGKQNLNVVQDQPGCGDKPLLASSPSPILHRPHLQKVLLIQPPAFSNNFRSDMNPNAALIPMDRRFPYDPIAASCGP